MAKRAVVRHLFLGSVPYREGWELQRRLARARRAGEIDDTLLLLEHPPVYTMGRNGEPEHLREGEQHLRELGADYVEVDRGGSVTFHGPGQLVVYPIVQLAGLFPIAGSQHGDVLKYLRALEEALIATVAGYGITAVQRPPYTGIWIEPAAGSPWRKLAAIGVKLAGGVTTHGVALNVTTDLSWFSHVVACGIPGAGVASIESLTGVRRPVADVAPAFVAEAAARFGCQALAADAALEQLCGRVPAKAG